MSTIITRSGKGSPLTSTEVDANFTNLNNDKVEKTGTSPVSVTVNSATNALRITQTGTGNALLVEDAANPDASPFVIDQGGNVINGATITYQGADPSGVVGAYQQHSTGSNASNNLSLFQWQASSALSAAQWLSFNKSRTGVIGTQVIGISGDTVGGISFAGSDGTAFIPLAYISAQVDGTPGTNDMPGRLVFSTTADGESTPTEKFRITNNGVLPFFQPNPTAVNATATLTIAQINTKIITSTTALAVTMTLPTGTLMDSGFSALSTNMAFDWSVINSGATNAVTIAAGATHTVVGNMTVNPLQSAIFRSRKTAGNTFVTYRIT